MKRAKYISNGTITYKIVGEQGPQGPKGEAGPQGPQGPQGPKGDAAPVEIVREEINKAINDGTISNYDDTEIKSSVYEIKEELAGVKTEEKIITSSEVEEITDAKIGSTIKVSSTNSKTVYSHGKNYLPFEIGTYDPNLTTVDETEESITLTIQPGSTFKHFKLKPIFLKAGTYTVSRKVDFISGDSLANAGTIYVFIGDTSASQTTNKKVFNKQSETITLDSDCWVMLDVYVNTNGNVSNASTFKFYNFQIEKSSSFTSYEKYCGENKSGTELTFSYFNGMGLYADSDVTITYRTLAQSSMSFAQMKSKILDHDTDIEKINDKLGITSTSNLVVCMGDSLTNGTGNEIARPTSETNLDTSYPAVLQRKLGNSYTVVNAGVGGEPSWMIAARQGGMPVSVLPATIPATTTRVRVYLNGMENDAYYNKDKGVWEYSKDTLSYNIAVDGNARINPCKINGIEGTLSRELLTSGSADPTTGETVQSNTYAYYFTRSVAGEKSTFTTPKTLITYASENYKNAINIIWAGQNDAPLINGKYFTQVGTEKRIRRMVEHGSDKYIVMQVPSSSDIKDIANEQAYVQEFGEHYINIRKFICTYCIELCKLLGYEFTRDTPNSYYGSTEVDSAYATVGDSLDAGVIPRVLRKDGVHGNYYYYQIVAIAVYERGKDLGYWN